MTFPLPLLWVALSLGGSLTRADLLHLASAQLPATLGQDSLRWTPAYGWSPLALPPGVSQARLVAPAGEPRPGLWAFTLELVGAENEVLRAVPLAMRCQRFGDGLKL